MTTSDEFVCAISGLAAPALAEPFGELETLPAGWAEVAITIRAQNPRWSRIQKAKEQMVGIQLAAVPDDQRDDATREFIGISVDANYAAIEAATPRYIDTTEVVNVHPDHLGQLFELLGITIEDDE